jgi:hypothetical protein
MTELYGKSGVDKLADENLMARKIVKEIATFGVSERQRCLIMYYLSLELEDVEKAQIISSFLKECLPDLTITGLYEGVNK